jgi:hypothetical protein
MSEFDTFFLSDRSSGRAAFRLAGSVVVACLLASPAAAQSGGGVLTSRSELMSAESTASRSHDGGTGNNALAAAAIRQRLRDGDFRVGDRVVVRISGAATRTDTLIVSAGPVLEVLPNITIPLSGVLRSEIQPLVKTEVLKYIKAHQVVVTPLIRVGILGEVARPGYFGFASDLPLTDAIMGAGGPSPTANVGRSVVNRGGKQYRSSEETRAAIAKGLTLDQFGLNAGDELIVGRRRELISPPILTIVGVLASVMTVFLAQSR